MYSKIDYEYANLRVFVLRILKLLTQDGNFSSNPHTRDGQTSVCKTAHKFRDMFTLQTLRPLLHWFIFDREIRIAKITSNSTHRCKSKGHYIYLRLHTKYTTHAISYIHNSTRFLAFILSHLLRQDKIKFSYQPIKNCEIMGLGRRWSHQDETSL